MPEPAKRIALEATINVCVDQLRAKGHEVTVVADRAVIDADADADGRLDANPDTGPGSEPGHVIVTVDGHQYGESFFSRYADAAAMTSAVEKDLAALEEEGSRTNGVEVHDDEDTQRIRLPDGGIAATEGT